MKSLRGGPALFAALLATAAGLLAGGDSARAEGLTATDALFFTQETAGIGDAAEQFDAFGDVLAAGDFNNDGFDDLAIGIPSEDRAQPDQGAINVLYGAADGLFSDTDQQFWDIGGTQQLGHSLAVADFDADGFDDLAVGFTYSGEEWITTYHGYPTGLDWQPTFSVRASDFTPGFVWDTSILAAGELNGDQYDDIVVQFDSGSPNGIMMLHGSAEGVTPDSTFGAFVFGSPSPTLPTAIALGDFDANTRDDIVLGFPAATVNAQSQAGEVRLFFNGSSGGSETWHQDSAGIVGGAEAGDQFGGALVAGDTNADGIDDVAIGVPFEDATFTDQGAVHRIMGDGSGLTSTSNQLFGAGGGNEEPNGHFGSALAAGNFDDVDYALEVAGGAPQDGATIFNSDAGTASILFTTATTSFWHQDVAGVPDAVEGNEFFGDAVAAGDFDGDGDDDLAIGAPGETVGPEGKFCGCHGAVTVLNGNRRQPLESVKQIIGPAGGTVGTGATDSVEAVLTVPPGALGADTSITIDAYSTLDVAPPPGGGNYLSRSYEFEPHGLTFATPATLQINYSTAEVAGMNEDTLGVWLFNSTTGQWEAAVVLVHNPPLDYMIVEIPHFSKMAARDFGSTDLDADGCSDAEEVANSPGSQMSGGLRNPAIHWDYMNPTDDGKNRIDDVLAVVGQYFDDDADGNPGLPPYAPGYDPDTDRTALGPNVWNLGPPNGQQRIDDILAIIGQYFHDCS